MAAQHKVLLVTSRPAQLKEFAEVFYTDRKMEVVPVGTAKEAISVVQEMAPVLAIVDDQVRGVEGLKIIQRLIEANAFIHTATISELTDQEFHNRSEGLGILAKLPLVPGRNDAYKLIEQLERMVSDLV